MDKDKAAFAHQYAKIGFEVIPVYSVKDGACECSKKNRCKSPGKHPRTLHGFTDSSSSTDQIDRWWQKHPNANVGVATGNKSGIVVLDIDPKNGGFESLAELQATHGELPKTYTVKTGGGGAHYYFQYPEGETHIKGSAGTISDGLDIRADGGFVVAPPSDHVSGGKYSSEDFNANIEVMPDWFLSLIIDRKVPAKHSESGIIMEGSRNSSLTSIAGKARSNGMPKSELKTFLLEENERRCCPPLDHEEVMKIVGSVTRYMQGEEKYLFTWREMVMTSKLETGIKQVLFALSFRMNKSGRNCFPTIEQLATYTSMSRKTVGKHLTHSEKLGWIKRYKHNSGNGNSYWNYGYIATDPPDGSGLDG